VVFPFRPKASVSTRKRSGGKKPFIAEARAENVPELPAILRPFRAENKPGILNASANPALRCSLINPAGALWANRRWTFSCLANHFLSVRAIKYDSALTSR